jgi:Fe2+ transport system protein B
MIEITEHTRNVLLKVAKDKKIFVEGNFLKILKAPAGDKEFENYLHVCKEKDNDNRRKRLQVTKQVQSQNKELEAAAKENEKLMTELKRALEESNELRAQAEQSMDKALQDLDLMQKRSQFELIGTIVKVALFVIIGVGVLTTVMYAIALMSGTDTQIIGSTWSNMFGILLTNAFSIVGTIMGVKYATEKSEEK